MQRINQPEILDSDACPSTEIEASLRDICRINRWFGGVATTRCLLERVASATGKKHFSVLEVAAELGVVPSSGRFKGASLCRLQLRSGELQSVRPSPGA